MAATITAGLIFGGIAPASATTAAAVSTATPLVAVQTAKKVPNKVTISKIKTAKVNKKTKKATVKPSVKSSGNVKVTSKKITVKQGKKTLVKNKNSASLKAGKYSVTTTAKYKTWTNKTTTKNVKKKVLVSGPKKSAKMNCVIDSTEFTDVYTGTAMIPVTVLWISCKGAFPGVYRTSAVHSMYPVGDWKPTKKNGGISWYDGVITGKVPKPLAGAKFTGNVKAVKNLYKTTTTKKKTTSKVWSQEKTKTVQQSLTVKK